jgi:hypothetical protein
MPPAADGDFGADFGDFELDLEPFGIAGRAIGRFSGRALRVHRSVL